MGGDRRADSADSYAWVRLRWDRIAILASPIALLIGLANGDAVIERILIIVVAEVVVTGLILAAMLTRATFEYGSYRAIEVVHPSRAARAISKPATSTRLSDSFRDITLAKVDRKSAAAVRELVGAIVARDRIEFDRLYRIGNFSAEGSGSDLFAVGLALLWIPANRRRTLRRPPPPLDQAAILDRMFGDDALFGDLASAPLAAGLLASAAGDTPAATLDADARVVMGSELGATTSLLLGATVLMADTEAFPTKWPYIYGLCLQQFDRQLDQPDPVKA